MHGKVHQHCLNADGRCWQRSVVHAGRLQQHLHLKSRQHHKQQHAGLFRAAGNCGSRNVAAAASASDPTAARTASPSVISSSHGDLVWASCVSSKTTVRSAVEDAVASILQQQPGLQPDLALVFASCNYGSQLQDVVRAIRREVPSVKHVFGCSAFGVLGGSPSGPVEVEGEPGISLTLAALPGVELSLMHTLRSSIPSEDASPEAWCDLVGMSPVQQLRPSPTPPDDDATAGSEDEQDKQQQQQQDGAEGASSKQSGASSEADQQQQQQEEEQQQEQQQQQPSSAVSMLVLCDPRFQQSKQLLAGLDFAFPDAPKVGAVLSQGQQNKRRLMYVWSADGSVQPGTAAWARKQQQRRQASRASSSAAESSSQQEQQQQSLQAAEQEAQPAVQQQQQQQQQAESNGSSKPKKQGGLFGNLFNALLSGLSDDDQQQQQQQQQQQATSSRPQPAAAADASSAAGDDRLSQQLSQANGAAAGDIDEEAEADDDSGVFMYGAAVLSMKGPLTLEPVTCQGYRTVSDKVWTIGQTSREGDLIATIIDPDPDTDYGLSSDDDDEGGSGGDMRGGEVVPLLAVYEVLMAAGFDPEAAHAANMIEELSSKLAVAIAPDSFRPTSELSADDFQVAAISEVWQRPGYIRVDCQARPGYRLRLVLRDERGIAEDLNSKLLGLKRSELAGVLSGKPRPRPLAALLFTDIGRGSMLYDSPSYESGKVSSFLPVPLAGVFGSAQVSTANSKAALYELTSALAVLRPLAPAPQTQELAKQEEQQ